MLDRSAIDDFLAQHRIAVVGASDKSGDFATVIAGELQDHGYEAVRVGRSGPKGGFTSLAEVPGSVDGVVVMVGPFAAADVVEEAAALGITRVWLFKGVGKGSCSDAAVAAAKEHGMTVVEGACPLMFLEPVKSVHRFHRGIRRLEGRYPKAVSAA